MMKKILTFIFLIGIITGCSGRQESSNSANTKEYKTYKWRLVTSWPKNYPGLGMAPERIADLVEEMSDGQMLFRADHIKWVIAEDIFGREKFLLHSFLLAFLLD
jgi:TRAP-type mannitol/chloroaromatic compound transport system substrate-binding protein